MSLKAIFDIVINFSFFNISDFHKVGSLHYKTAIYYILKSDPLKKKKYAYPSNIYHQKIPYSQTLKKYSLISLPTLNQPYITQDQIHFISREFPVNFVNRNFAQNTACYWKIYIDVENIDLIDFFIEVQLIYKQYGKDNYTKYNAFQNINFDQCQKPEVVATFKGRINKPYDIFSYLPICFDDFESLQLNSTYHAIISQFKFSHNDEDHINQQNKDRLFFSFGKKSNQLAFGSFKDYLNNVTQNYLSSKIRVFYSYYKQFLVSIYQNLSKRKNNYKINLQKRTKSIQQLNQAKDIIHNLPQKFTNQYNSMYRSKYQQLDKFQQSKLLMADIILEDFAQITKKIYVQWIKFNKLIKDYSYKIIHIEQRLYRPLIQQRYKNNVFSHKVKIQKNNDFTFSRYDDSGKSHFEQAKIQNKKIISQSDVWSGQFLIEDLSFTQKEQKNLKIFEQRYELQEQLWEYKRSKTQDFIHFQNENQFISEDLNKKQINSQHIIFLVHGFGASRIDMLLLKSFIERKYCAQVIISVQNIGRTQNSIQTSGDRLANEVKSYLNKINQNFKLSFIGHSMGGLIIRSAIPKLQKYRFNFHTYISICTPHIGYLYQPSSLIKLGLWMLSQVQKCQSLAQIEMKDTTNLRRCYLYNLAMNDSLNWFKNIAFVASSQDSYVPYQSARVEKSERILSQMQIKDKQRAQVIKQMVDKIIKNLKQAKQISRIDVIFNIEQTTLQALIGRVGHVKFLSDEQFIKQFVICFKRFFE